MSDNDKPERPSILPETDSTDTVPATDSSTHKHTTSSSSLHNAKGWDGKLRVEKRAVLVNPEALDGQRSEPEDSEDEEVKVDQIDADEDLTAEFEADVDEIDLVHCRIRSIPALQLDRFTNVKRLCLRQNQIQEAEFPENIASTVVELDLYDNLIAHIKGFDRFPELTSLDLSFNKIKHIKRINHLHKLKNVYFVANKITTIENLDGLSNLRNLELGGNRIRTIQGLDTLTSLEELWLGKNKLTEIANLTCLSHLKILSIQANRLRSMQGLSSLVNLEQLHISHNAITEISGLESNINLQVIDISANPIEHLTGLETLAKLEELWASWCKIESFDEVEKQLADKESLETVYFEGNLLQSKNPVLYRNKIRLALPRVKQIDATFVRVS